MQSDPKRLEPEKIYDVARRYAACTYAIADVFGIDPYEMLCKHREVISNVFQQASREGLKVRREARIPKLRRIVLANEAQKGAA